MRVKAVQLASILLSLSVCTGVQAAGKRSNFLLGGEFGVETRHTNYAYNYVVDPNIALVPGYPEKNSTRITDAGTLLGLLAGWQVQCGRTLLGLEGNVDFHSYEQNKQVVFTDGATIISPAYAAAVKYERGTVYQLSGRAGWFLMPSFMPYVRLGVQFSRDQLSFSAPVRQVVGQESFSAKESVWSGVGGIGVEIPAFGPTSVRVEFNYVYTPNLSWTDNVNVNLAQNIMENGTHSVDHPKSYVGKIAWVWNFE